MPCGPSSSPVASSSSGAERHPRGRCVMPHGAFYVFPNVDSVRAAERRDRDPPAVRRRGVRPGRDRVRPPRGGIPALQLREQPGEPPAALERISDSLAPGAERRAGHRRRMTAVQPAPPSGCWPRRRPVPALGARPRGHRRGHRPALNYRQSGHPGGSRSRSTCCWPSCCPGHALGHPPAVAAVRRSVRALGGPHRAAHLRHPGRPERTAAGPRRARPGPRFVLPDDGAGPWTGRTCSSRRRGGLPGHAEMEGKTLFLKWNTGPRATASRRRWARPLR